MARRNGTASWDELGLGIAVAALVSLAIVAVSLLGTTRGPFAPETYPLILELDDAAGIRVGSFVTVGGMAAGEIASLEIVARGAPPRPIAGDTLLPPTQAVLNPTDIRLELAVQERFQRYITESSRAQLANVGLGGERYVKITAGDVREDPIPPGGKIEEIPSVDWDLILAKLSRAISEMEIIAAQTEEIKTKTLAGGGTAGRLLDVESPIYSSLDALVEESESLLDLLDQGQGVIPRYGSHPALRENLVKLTDDLEAIDSMAEGGAFGGWAEPVELERALAALRADVDDLSGRLDGGRGTLGMFLNDQELYVQIRVLQTRIAEVVAAFRADPLGFINIEIF